MPRKGKPENLKSWPKGKSGNPKGRPRKEDCVTSLMREYLETIPEADKKTRTRAQLLVEAAFHWAMKGKDGYFREIMKRLEGNVAQPLVGKDGGAIKLESLNPYEGMTLEELRAEKAKRTGGNGSSGV